MSQWYQAAKLTDCPSGESKEVVVAGRLLAIFNQEGTIYALDGVCRHQGGPLAKGKVTNGVVTCPWHGWQFDIRDGQHQINPKICQPCFETKIEEDTIWVNLPEA